MSALKFEEDAAKGLEKQGIVTILGSDFELVTKVPPSLRRTISADMSSKKWLAQNGGSPMKRIASSEELFAGSDCSSFEDEEMNDMPSQDDVWSSIQAHKGKDDKLETQPMKLNAWSSILAVKTDSSSHNLPPPYVHPLVRRSASLLSQKSLEICTESLGSETGSDGFSSYPKSFPPPLPSIARGDGPSSLLMHSYRGDGRLVLEAISVPRQDYFQAERQGGRFLLTLVNNPASQDPYQEGMRDQVVEEYEQVFSNFVEVDKRKAKLDEEEDEGNKQEKDIEKQNGMELAMEKSSSLLMMKMLMVGLKNKDPTWSSKLNKPVNLMEESSPILQSLPLTPRVARLIPSPPPPAAAATFNAYEYFWRNKATMASRSIKSLTQHTNTKDNGTTLAKTNCLRPYDQQQDMVFMRGSNKIDHLVPLFKGCKESRRSLLLWQPYCIATS